MNFINSPVEFIKKNRSLYNYIYQNTPGIMDILFPNRRKGQAEGNKKQLIEIARSGVDRPKRSEKFAREITRYTTIKSDSYDPVFTETLKQIAPHWFNPHLAILKKLTALAPENVKIMSTNKVIKGQLFWDLIDKEYGAFTGRPGSLIKAWEKGLTGHPKRGRKRAAMGHRRAIINLTTNDMFISVKEAALSFGIQSGNLSVSIKKGRKAGGHYWAYCDENGNILDKPDENSKSSITPDVEDSE